MPFMDEIDPTYTGNLPSSFPTNALATPDLTESQRAAMAAKTRENAPLMVDTAIASFDQKNMLTGLVVHPNSVDNYVENGYNAWDEVKKAGREKDWGMFGHSNNPRYTQYLFAEADRKKENERVSAASGTFGVFTDLLAGVLDLPTLIPVGGIGAAGAKAAVNVSRSARAATIARNAATVGVLNGVAVGVQEAGLQYTQEYRPLKESYTNVRVATLLGGVLGGGMAAYATRGGHLAASEAALAERLNPDSETAKAIAAEQTYFNPEGGSVGAARVTPEFTKADLAPKGAVVGGIIDKLNFTPNLRASDALSTTAARTYADLSESAFTRNVNVTGEGIQAVSARADTLGKQWEIQHAYEDIRSWLDQRKLDPSVTREDFNQMVNQAIENGGKAADGNPAVERAAAAVQKVLGEARTNMEQAGMFTKATTPEGRALEEAYIPRIFKSQVVRDNEFAFKDQFGQKFEKDLGKAFDTEAYQARSQIDEITHTSTTKSGNLGNAVNLASENKLSAIETRVFEEEQAQLTRLKTTQTDIQRRIDKAQTTFTEKASTLQSNLGSRVAKIEARYDAQISKLEAKGNKTQEIAGLRGEKAQRIAELKSATRDSITRFDESTRSTVEGLRTKIADTTAQIEERVAKVKTLKEERAAAIKTASEARSAAIGKKADESLAKKIDKIKEDFHTRWGAPLGADAGTRAEVVKGHAEALAKETWDKIAGRTGKVVGAEAFGLKFESGPLKERKLTDGMSYKEVAKWIETDPRAYMQSYSQSVAADIELTKRFGDKKMTAVFKKIENEYNDMRTAVEKATTVEDAYRVVGRNPSLTDDVKALVKGEKTLEEVKAQLQNLIQNNEKTAVEDILALRDRIRKTYLAAENASGFAEFARSAKHMQYLVRMGGVSLSNLTEIVRIPVALGLTPYFERNMLSKMRSPTLYLKNAEELKLAGLAANGAMATMATNAGDLATVLANEGGIERVLRTSTHWMSHANGINMITNFNQNMAGQIIQHNILKAIMEGGALKGDMLEKLGQLGLGAEKRARIKGFLDKHMLEENGTMSANTKAWGDSKAAREAALDFHTAINQDVRTFVVSGTPGNMPLFMSKPLLQLMLQFRGYSIASFESVTLAGLQGNKAALMQQIVSLTAAGMFVSYLKASASNAAQFKKWETTVKNNPAAWVADGLNQSGLFALIFDAVNTAQLATGRTAFQDPNGTRGRAVDTAKLIAGPSVQYVDDVARAAGTAGKYIAGEPTKADARQRAVQTIPGAGLIYFRPLIQFLTGNLDKEGR